MKRLLLSIVVCAALSCAALAQFSLAGAGLYSEKETKTTMSNNIAIFFSARDAYGNRIGTFDGSTLRKPAVVRGMVLDGTIIPLNWDVKSFDLKFVPLEEAYGLDVADPSGWIIGRKAKGDLAFRYKIDTASLPNGDNIWVARVVWSNRKDHTAFLFVHWPSHSDGGGQELLALVVREMPPGLDPLTALQTADLRGVQLYPYTEGFTSLVASPSGAPQQTIIPGVQAERTVTRQEVEAATQKGQAKVDDPVPARPANPPVTEKQKRSTSIFDIRTCTYVLSDTRAQSQQQKAAIKRQLEEGCKKSDPLPAHIRDLTIPDGRGRAIWITASTKFTVDFVDREGKLITSLPVEKKTVNGQLTYTCLVPLYYDAGESPGKQLVLRSDSERQVLTFTGR